MKKVILNECILKFPSLSRNESLSRSAAAAFALQCDPTVEETAAIKTAVSEAVTNCVVHGYRGSLGVVEMIMRLYADGLLRIIIRDKGCGIPDIKAAMRPEYSTAPPEEERSGLGFTVMESFCDSVRVRSTAGRGTSVTLDKYITGKRRGER